MAAADLSGPVRSAPSGAVGDDGARGGGSWGAVLVLLTLVWLAGVVTVGRGAFQGTESNSTVGPVLLLECAIAGAAAAAAARQAGLDPRVRLAWWRLAAGHVLGLVSCVLFALSTGFPTWADAVRLAMGPVLLVGLLTFPAQSTGRTARQKVTFDLVIVSAGAFMAIWYWSLGSVVTTQRFGALWILTAVCYPITDLAMVYCASAVLVQARGLSERRPLMLIGLGLLCLVAADVQRGHRLVQPGALRDTSTTGAEWLCLLTGFGLLAAAGVEQCRLSHLSAAAPAFDRALRRFSALPLLALALGYGLLLMLAMREGLYPWGGLITAAMVMTGAVVARQVVVLRENQRLLATDSLTGLASRPLVRDRLRQAAAAAARTGRPAAILVIDMDGFKQVNDTLGHDAGDELLVAFAGQLMGAVSRTDTVGRLGGDEFAVVLPAVGDEANAVSVAERVLTGTASPVMVGGRQVQTRASIGIALSVGETDVGVLLDRADQAMYAAKRRSGNCWAMYTRGADTMQGAGGIS